MPAVRRKYDRRRISVDRSRRRFQFPVKELVETFKGFGMLEKLRRIQPIFLDEWCNSLRADRAIHPPAVPLREERPFREGVQRQLAHARFISPAHEPFTVNLFGFDFAGIPVEKANRLGLHSVRKFRRNKHGYRLFVKREAPFLAWSPGFSRPACTTFQRASRPATRVNFKPLNFK